MTHLEEVLASLKNEVQAMALLVLKQLKKTKKALLENDKHLAQDVLHGEKRVNAFELKIDMVCENIVALYNPVAKDMRMVFAFFKINAHLERMGDYAKNISKDVANLKQPYNAQLLEDLKIERMFDIANEMISQNISAMTISDTEAARSIFDMDQELNKLNSTGNTVIAEYAKLHPDEMEDLLNLASTLRRLERVGDYNTNIAEELIFYFDAMVLKHNK
jgi:phosphate transport system protein